MNQPVTAQQSAAVSAFSPRRLLMATLAAALLNLVAFWIGKAAGAAMKVNTPYEDISWGLVLGASLIPLGVGGALVWGLARLHPPIVKWARALGVAVALLSIVSPFLASLDSQTGVALAMMHIVGAAAWYVGLTPTMRTN